MLTRLELDDAADRLLAARGYDHDSVPPEGEVVFLRKTANLSTGGTAIDVTDVIHPDNKLMAERAIRAVGLDIGGVDFLTTDITQSYRDTGGAICEINAGPGMRMHIAPSRGQGPRRRRRGHGHAVPGRQRPSRIPIAALTGTNGKTTTARMLAHVLKMAGFVVGQTSTDAVYIDGNVTVKGDMTGPKSASHGAARPDGRHGGDRDRPRRHRPRRPRLPLLRRGRGAQRHLRPPRPRRRQLARGARRGQAPRRRGGQGLRRPQRRQRIHAEDGRLHPGEAHLLRHPQRPTTRWCASTSSSASAPWCWSRG